MPQNLYFLDALVCNFSTTHKFRKHVEYLFFRNFKLTSSPLKGNCATLQCQLIQYNHPIIQIIVIVILYNLKIQRPFMSAEPAFMCHLSFIYELILQLLKILMV